MTLISIKNYLNGINIVRIKRKISNKSPLNQSR